ncbi:hypothetical protein CF166_17005 [Amycolatopsis sp. KNN50.9b]|nr:hypothetical protein CF166_17005 [Amycolatopsis sp. KNN50.9b]
MASSGVPGQGGAVAATTSRPSGPARNWKVVPSGIVRHAPGVSSVSGVPQVRGLEGLHGIRQFVGCR